MFVRLSTLTSFRSGRTRGRHSQSFVSASRERGSAFELPRKRDLVTTYHVAYDRDESGWWVASIRKVRGCHTQGRTVDEARRRIRKAMELFIDDARSAKLVDHVKLPARASKAIRLYAALRKHADREDQRACLAAR